MLCSGRKEMNISVKNEDTKPKTYQYGFKPKSFYPAISEQVYNDNYIELPKLADYPFLNTKTMYPWEKNTGGYGETDILDDGGKGNFGLNFNMCSKACCSQQYPPPFSITPDDFVLRSGQEFVPSSYTCNNGWQDSGCLCMTKDQALFLNRRGGNAYNEI